VRAAKEDGGKKMAVRNPGSKERASCPQDYARPFFQRGLFAIALDGLSEEGLLVVYDILQPLKQAMLA